MKRNLNDPLEPQFIQSLMGHDDEDIKNSEMDMLSKRIVDVLIMRTDNEKAKWLENYVKHGIKSVGVGIPEIRKIIIDTVQEIQLSSKSNPEQVQMLDGLMRQDITEAKIAAIIYIQLFWKNTGANTILDLVSGWFDRKLISDWNVCDWLCVRILSPLLDKDVETVIPELTLWNKDAYLWKARASLVPFAQCKSIKDHGQAILAFSEKLIKREERFCKTAVGWVLREYSKHDKTFVLDFLEAQKEWTTPEVVNNAMKYLKQKAGS